MLALRLCRSAFKISHMEGKLNPRIELQMQEKNDENGEDPPLSCFLTL